MCSKLDVSFIGLQKTKMKEFDLFLLRSVWGNFSFDLATSSAQRHSREVISMWDPAVFIKKKITCTNNVVIIQRECMFSKFNCYMVNVYAPQEESKKKDLWNFLLNFMNRNKGAFLFFGDFNEIRNLNE